MVHFALLMLIVLGAGGLHARCPASALAPMPLVLEYAVWRGWQQALVYTADLETNCQWAILRLVKCMGVNGIAVAVDVNNIEGQVQSHLGVVILSSRLRRNDTSSLSRTVNQIIKFGFNTASHDWLLVAKSEYDVKLINGVLNVTAMRFDQNIVAVYPRYIKSSGVRSSLAICDTNFLYEDRTKSVTTYNNNRNDNKQQYNNIGRGCRKNEYEKNYYRTSRRFQNITRNLEYTRYGTRIPLYRSGIFNLNKSIRFLMSNASDFSLLKQFTSWNRDNGVSNLGGGMHIVQYFKVRYNSTLYMSYLGVWWKDGSMSWVETPYPVEKRNFMGEDLIVGRRNSSGDGMMGIDDDGPSAPALLDDVLNYLTIRLNVTPLTRYYGKLGFRTYGTEGIWTGLLGALRDSSVDIALEPVTAISSSSGYQDMEFIFPIAKTMCNIYIRHQETSAVRDIFLAPFSARLVACVVAVALVASFTIVVISRVATKLCPETRKMSCTESLIWSIGILCQQGGPWTPSNSAASIVLIVCLLFAVVTYNAYAAFITSVLSVRVPSVGTVSDVLHSPNFKIGYIRNGADQMYLMSTKDVQLNAFYIRGYSEAENLVTSAEEGLARAARQDYAFFAGQLAARSTLRILSQARGRCALRELPVPSTRAQLAFPLPKKSPYARPILLSLLELRASGALARLESALVPSMPQCAPPSGFASARAADVRTALLLILAGAFAASFIGVYVTQCCSNYNPYS